MPAGNFPTKTVSNSAGRTAATPDFIGQVLSQRDTRKLYFGTALTAGSWQEIDYATGLSLITGAENDFFQWKSGAWTNRTPAQAKVDLGWNAALYPPFITSDRWGDHHLDHDRGAGDPECDRHSRQATAPSPSQGRPTG